MLQANSNRFNLTTKIDAYLKPIQPINFTRNLEKDNKTFFIIEEAKEIILHFSHGTVRVL